MKNLLLLFYEMLASLAPLALLLFACRRRLERRSLLWQAGLLLLIFYTAFLLHLTEAGTLWDGLNVSFRLQPRRINLIPFIRELSPAYHRLRNVVLCLLNVVIFLPLGFLAAGLWPDWDRPGRAVLLGAVSSLLIEVCQLLNHRFTDIDDLICNTAGALLGWALWRLLSGGRKREADAPGWELPLFLLALLAGRFFLFNATAALRLLGL